MRQPVCRGQPRRSSTRKLAAFSGGCLGVVDAVWCVRDALWKMMCALMRWCPAWLVDWSIFHMRFYYAYFSSLIGPSPYINQVIIFSISLPPYPKLRFKILNASSSIYGFRFVIVFLNTLKSNRRNGHYDETVPNGCEWSGTL